MSAQRQDRACIECRRQKIKCNTGPSSDDKRRCQRCSRMDLRCEYVSKKQRTKKRLLSSRVDQLERVYTEILPLLSKDAYLQEDTAPAADKPHAELGTIHHNSLDRNMNQGTANLESSLRIYRSMSTEHHPYVIIPSQISAATLVEKRPLLAHAITLVTCWNMPADRSRQQEEFLKELSARYFIKDERSLDMLQALLVYFGWCQWYIGCDNLRAYRFASLIVNVALELGVNEPSPDANQHAVIMQSCATKRVNCQPIIEGTLDLEVMRAYLGAYEASTHCCFLFRKPSPLTFTKYLGQCLNHLRTKSQYPTDITLTHSLEPLRIAEMVIESFHHGTDETMQQMNEGKVKVLLKAFAREFDDWEASLPAQVRHDPRMVRSIHMSRVYIHEVGLYELVPHRCPSAAREQIVLQCFTSSKHYITHVLGLPYSALIGRSYFEWRCLNYAMMINCRAATILDSLCCRDDSAERAEWIDFCHETLTGRLRMLNTSGQHDFLERMINSWTRAKTYYHHAVREALADNVMSGSSDLLVPSSDMPNLVDPLLDLSLYNMTWSTFGVGATGDNFSSHDGW